MAAQIASRWRLARWRRSSAIGGPTAGVPVWAQGRGWRRGGHVEVGLWRVLQQTCTAGRRGAICNIGRCGAFLRSACLSAHPRAQDSIRLDMRSLAYVEHSSGVPGSVLAVAGQLQLRQQRIVRVDSLRTAYAEPILFNSTAPYQLVRPCVGWERKRSRHQFWCPAETMRPASGGRWSLTCAHGCRDRRRRLTLQQFCVSTSHGTRRPCWQTSRRFGRCEKGGRRLRAEVVACQHRSRCHLRLLSLSLIHI